MDEYITRAEHAEFCARLDAENNRQNRRIEILEGTTKQISELTTSVQKLAMSVENMVKEQGRQGDRLAFKVFHIFIHKLTITSFKVINAV